MEKSELKKTKKKLTIIFTIMIFLLVSILWISYFVYKYLTEERESSNSFKNFVNSVASWYIKKEDIVNRNFFRNFRNQNIEQKTEKKQKIDEHINYILFDEKENIVSSDVRFNISESLAEKISNFRENYKKNFLNNSTQNLEDDEEDDDEIEYDDDFFETNFSIPTFHNYSNYSIWLIWNFVFIKENRYPVSACFSDILWFMVLNLLFSVVFYLVWYKFVSKTFKPVEENISDMKNFIHNAGHELKTPIAVIDSNIQLMLEMKTYDEEMIKELKVEILKLNSLLDSLIKLSDIWSFSDTERVNLSEVIEDILKNFSSKIEQKNLLVEKNLDEKVFVTTNRNYLYIFISNIIWNSIKYNKINWKIKISYNSGLIIEDTWIWISKEDKEKIFDRFFKCDKSRNSEGFWIWLSLVRKIADTYNWNIKVESELEKWSKFTIKF